MKTTSHTASCDEAKAAQSQLSLQVRLGEQETTEEEMLATTHLRPYVSVCPAAHYPGGKALPGEQLTALICPGENRFTSDDRSVCLLSFLVEIEKVRSHRRVVDNPSRRGYIIASSHLPETTTPTGEICRQLLVCNEDEPFDRARMCFGGSRA